MVQDITSKALTVHNVCSLPLVCRIQEVFALRGPEVHTEIQVSELLQSFVSSPSIRLVPILQHLANTPSTPCPLEGQSMISAAITKLDALPKAPANKRHKGVGKNKRKDDGSGPTDQREASIEGAGSKCRALVEQCIERFRLNEDQASVLRHVASWLSVGFEDGIPQPPVCLVHGPFGRWVTRNNHTTGCGRSPD